MCLRKIWPQRFLDSPPYLLDGFWGPKDGFFGFSSGGYQERGAQSTGGAGAWKAAILAAPSS